MVMGKWIDEKGGHVAGFRAEISRVAGSSRDEFFCWFDSSSSASESLIRGAWDFSIHVAYQLSGLIDNPHTKTCLDLGYGGGRMLAASARHFHHAIGVDIHEEFDLVRIFLKNQGITNITLHCADGTSLPVEDQSVQVVYSFIVMQHMESIDVFQKAIGEIYRCLSPGGVAVLYFGRISRFSFNKESLILALADKLLEELPFTPAYQEKRSRVNETNLAVSRRYARKLFSKTGFRIVRWVFSRRRAPDGGNLFGSQTGAVLVKDISHQ